MGTIPSLFLILTERRYLMGALNVGVDLGVKSSHHAVILDEEDKTVKEKFRFKTTLQDLRMFYETVSKHAKNGAEIRVITEPTGMAWYPVCQYLMAQGCKVYRPKTQKSHDLRQYFSKHTKSDHTDALTLAKMPLVDEDSLYEVYIRKKDVNTLKRLLKQREKLVAEATRYKQRITDILRFAVPGLSKAIKKLKPKVKREFLKNYTNPHNIKNLGQKRLQKWLSRRMKDENKAKKLAAKIHRTCIEAIEIYRKKDTLDFTAINEEVNRYLRLLENLAQEIRELKIKIKKTYQKTSPDKLLTSIPGLGEIAAPLVYALIGDANRFPNEKAQRGWIGLVPGKDSSGFKDRKGVKCTKAGPNQLKHMLYLAADVARQYDPQIAKVYYREMVKKGNCHTKAVCACATRLSNRIRAVLREGRRYDFRDTEGNKISKKKARILAQNRWQVPEEVRKRLRNSN